MRMPKEICTVTEFTNDDGRFIEVRDSRGVKCIYRWDEGEATVDLDVASDGTLSAVSVTDFSHDDLG